MGVQAFTAQWLFDGETLRRDHALLVEAGRVAGCGPQAEVPADAEQVEAGEGILAPGFVDLQVNGGGGVMLNDAPRLETLRTIAQAHARLGTAALLPTLITDTREHTRAAIAAAREAVAAGVPGIAGLHLEGPHLSVARKGAHDPALIRPMDAADLTMLTEAARALPALMLTVAPETVTPEQIAALARAGAVVSLGHSDADYATCARAVDAGARCATHLFNAMSQLGNREPGLVGAALDLGGLSCGLIADGIHVHPASMGAALRAKQGPGAVFLVTDAMAPAGTDVAEFRLNGRVIARKGGRLTLADGTLAGADLDMATALSVLVHEVQVPLTAALRMATSAPANVIGAPVLGRLSAGDPADFVHLSPDLKLQGFWRRGQPVA